MHWLTRQVVIVAVVSVPGLFASVGTGSDQSRDEFVRAAAGWLPSRPVVVEFEAEGESAGRTVAGLDARTGAWFMATQVAGVGRDAQGGVYRILEDSVVPVRVEQTGSPWALGWLIPQAFILAIVEEPGIIQRLERNEAGWTVVCSQPGSAPLGNAVIRIDAGTGNVLSFQLENPDDRRKLEFDWSRDGVGLAGSADGMTTQTRKQVDWSSGTAEFTSASVARRVVENRVQVGTKLQALAAGYRQDSQGEWIAPEPSNQEVARSVDPFTRRYRVPLLVGGVLVLGIAAAQIIRRRSAV